MLICGAALGGWVVGYEGNGYTATPLDWIVLGVLLFGTLFLVWRVPR